MRATERTKWQAAADAVRRAEATDTGPRVWLEAAEYITARLERGDDWSAALDGLVRWLERERKEAR